MQSALTERDVLLLGWLADHGVLTTDQIADALFPSVNVAQRRLRTLQALHLIDRFRPQRPDGGSYPYHWLLAQLGTDVTAAQRGEEFSRRDAARARRWQLTRRANLPHLLGVNGFFTALAAHARTHPEARLVRWWPAARCQRAGAFAATGPGVPFDPRAMAYRPRVRPDGHGIFTDNGHTTAFMFEYDLGTEPLTRLVDKIDGYRHLTQVTGNRWPVLFWLPSPTREQHLHEALTDAGITYPVATAVHGHQGRSLHATTPDDVTGHPAGPIWWLHRHPGPVLRLAALESVTAGLADGTTW